ncbi:MAG: glutamate--tRNA ligase [Candidatus Niyogibacteria bacterium]|nr:glutamate--tRNA ligase [Candidatus Niyogibacteria bacterium]
MSLRVRIAPSPTGPLHVGTARSALFNYLFAKKEGGAFILRIDDTDKKRSDKAFEEDIKKNLLWLGISWDDSIRQSERTALYRKHLQKLLEEGILFRCSHTSAELAQEREELIKNKQTPMHRCKDRDAVLGGGILRFKNMETAPVVFHDEIRGNISFDPKILGDFSVARDIDSPLYNFTTVVDDIDLGITHVIRGEDHIPNTPKQILLARALGHTELFSYAHLPLILGKDRSKLSKRHGAVAISQYQKEGYLPDAMINFLALLGWHPKKQKAGERGKGQEEEIFSREELIGIFSLHAVQRGGAIFDPEKLKWMNGVYIRQMNVGMLANLLLPYLKDEWRKQAESDGLWWGKIVILEQERLGSLQDIGDRIGYFFEEPLVKKEVLMGGFSDTVRIASHLRSIQKIIEGCSAGNFTKDVISEKVLEYAGQHAKKEVLWPFRVSLTGKKASPGLFEVAEILGKKTVLKRLEYAATLLES